MRAKRCAERSIQTVRDELQRHLGGWLSRPLAGIRPNECAVRLERITRDFRALPPCPVRRVTFNRVRRRREPTPWAKLPNWKKAVDAIQNPIRRDLQLFILFTGPRSTDAKTVPVGARGLRAGTIHRPRTEGRRGPRVHGAGLAGGAGDPAQAAGRELRDLPARRRLGLPVSQHARPGHPRAADEGGALRRRPEAVRVPKRPPLRDTFASAADEAGIDLLSLKVLMNHALPSAGDVTEGYIRPSVDHLREAAEKIAAFLQEKMGEQPLPGTQVG